MGSSLDSRCRLRSDRRNGGGFPIAAAAAVGCYYLDECNDVVAQIPFRYHQKTLNRAISMPLNEGGGSGGSVGVGVGVGGDDDDDDDDETNDDGQPRPFDWLFSRLVSNV